MRYSDEMRAEFKRLCESGCAVVDVCGRLCISRETARKWRLEMGLPRAKAGRKAGKKATATKDPPELQQLCLNCKRKKCTGWCDDARRVKSKLKEEHIDG